MEFIIHRPCEMMDASMVVIVVVVGEWNGMEGRPRRLIGMDEV